MRVRDLIRKIAEIDDLDAEVVICGEREWPVPEGADYKLIEKTFHHVHGFGHVDKVFVRDRLYQGTGMVVLSLELGAEIKKDKKYHPDPEP